MLIDSDRRAILRSIDKEGVFDRAWRRQAHRLLMILLSVRSGSETEEWADLMTLFHVAARSGSLGLSRHPFPAEGTAAVLAQWRRYRDFARAVAEASWYRPDDWAPIKEKYPDLYARAMPGPFQKAVWDQIYEPTDVIWIALIFGKMSEVIYRGCESPGCERYADVPFPKRRGPQPLYCDKHNADRRRVARHKKKRKDIDKQCLEAVQKALRSLPARERYWSSEPERRALAARLYRMTRKQLDKFRGHGPKWIGKQINKGGPLDAYKQNKK